MTKQAISNPAPGRYAANVAPSGSKSVGKSTAYPCFCIGPLFASALLGFISGMQEVAAAPGYVLWALDCRVVVALFR